MEEIRLNKYLSQMGVCSRREADRLIETGKVLVDRRPASAGMKIKADQTVICDGRPVKTGKAGGRPRPVLLAVNKPKGIVCTTSDRDRAVNIVELVQYPERVYPIGRLDKDSEGLIFLTNQGELVNRILRGANNHEKEYVVQVNRDVTGEFVRKMEEGLWLEELNVTTKPCRVTVTGRREFHIVLTQGLNRQIRRMCKALGYSVISLRRIRIMNVCLGNLKSGSFRRVTAQEYETLIKMLEGSR